MGLFRRLAGMLGFAKDDNHEDDDDDDVLGGNTNTVNEPTRNRVKLQETGLPRKGFAVPVQVVVDRPQLAPIVVPCSSGDGEVQGLRWYGKRMRIDEDGDVADEFLEEVKLALETSSSNEEHHPPKFKVKYSTRAARVKKQVISKDGKLQQCVEHRGRLEWV